MRGIAKLNWFAQIVEPDCTRPGISPGFGPGIPRDTVRGAKPADRPRGIEREFSLDAPGLCPAVSSQASEVPTAHSTAPQRMMLRGFDLTIANALY